MVDPLQAIIKFVFDNIFYFAGLGVLIYFIHGYLDIKRVEKLSSVNRGDIERKNMIERLRYNPSKKFKWLYKDKELLGKITHIIETTTKGNPENIDTYTMIVEPMLIKLLKIINPFAKKQILEVEKSGQILSFFDSGGSTPKQTNKLIIREGVAITSYMGIYYTIGKNEATMVDNIRQFDTFKTDLNNLSSIYFVKSQEQSTYAPQYAHELAMKEKEIQLMMAQKKGKLETI